MVKKFISLPHRDFLQHSKKANMQDIPCGQGTVLMNLIILGSKGWRVAFFFFFPPFFHPSIKKLQELLKDTQRPRTVTNKTLKNKTKTNPTSIWKRSTFPHFLVLLQRQEKNECYREYYVGHRGVGKCPDVMDVISASSIEKTQK